MEINPGTKIMIYYSQQFMGETLDDEYITYVDNIRELEDKVEALYSDPHVISVDWVVL